MYLTADPDGRELCLRPDLTIPVSRDYLASPAAGGRARLLLPRPGVPRSRRAARPNSCRPASSRSAAADKAAADAEMLALGLEATAHYGIAEPEIRMGDVGLFAALVAALDLAPAWKRRLVKDFNRKTSLAHDLDRLTLGGAAKRPEYQGVLAAMAGSDPEGRARWSPICCRSPASPRSAAARSARSPSASSNRPRSAPATALPRETRALIERFLAITGDPDEAAAELRALAADARLGLDARARPVRKPHRLSRRARRRCRPHPLLDRVRPRPRLLHRLRVRAARRRPAPNGPLVAGGRYDELLTRLGAKAPIPAVGFAVWIERATASGGAK